MDTSTVRPADWIAALGGLVLLIALFFLDWYSLELEIAPLEIGAAFLAQVEPPTEVPIPQVDVDETIGAWDGEGFLGAIANLIMLAAAVWAIVAVGFRAGVADVELGIEAGRLTMLAGIAAAIMVFLRIIFTPGGDGVDTSLEFGIFVALAGAILIALGGVMSGEGGPRAPAAAPRREPPPPAPPTEPPPPPPPSEPPPR
jgi:hypothetical protein